jgi:hypothetical protein
LYSYNTGNTGDKTTAFSGQKRKAIRTCGENTKITDGKITVFNSMNKMISELVMKTPKSSMAPASMSKDVERSITMCCKHTRNALREMLHKWEIHVYVSQYQKENYPWQKVKNCHKF